MICVILSLFLISVQGDCYSIPEYAQEAETECCVMPCSVMQAAVTVAAPERFDKTILAETVCRQFRKSCIKPQAVDAGLLPVRILCCVFRE